MNPNNNPSLDMCPEARPGADAGADSGPMRPLSPLGERALGRSAAPGEPGEAPGAGRGVVTTEGSSPSANAAEKRPGFISGSGTLTFESYVSGEISDQVLIAAECDRIRDFLLEKNRRYGSSALSPRRIFSKADPIEQINVRIDDKLSRIANGFGDAGDEDTELDLIGYLILKRVARSIGGRP